MSEERKILDMLAAGQISVEEASQLLDAMRAPSPPRPPEPPKPKKTAKLLRIMITMDDERSNVRVNIPLGLVRFASKFIPEEAKVQLAAQGIDLTELIEALDGDIEEGRLVDIESMSDEDEETRIIIEVV
jgi:hypothetical protein